MANPLMGMMGGTGPVQGTGINMQAIGQVRQMMNTLKAVKNPQVVLEQVAQQNPQFNAVMHMCQGRDPKEVFYEECKKQGVNPDEIIKMLNG